MAEDTKYSIDELRQRNSEIEEASEEIGDSFALETARSFIKKKKIPVPYMSPEKVEDIEFPEKTSILTDDQLTQAMSDWTKLMSYTNYLVSEADIEKTAKTNQFNYTKSRNWENLRKSGKSEEDTRKGVEKVPEVAHAKKMAEVASAKYKLLDSLLWGYTKNYNMLSRELTKRGIINPADGRDAK